MFVANMKSLLFGGDKIYPSSVKVALTDDKSRSNKFQNQKISNQTKTTKTKSQSIFNKMKIL